MEATDAAETIQEASEHSADEQFRRRAAIVIGVLAMLLAIASLGGENATKETINSNIQASDTWAFFQAKNIRQTSYQLAADELEVTLAGQPNIAVEVRANIQARLERYRATVARYDDEPDPSDPQNPLKGEGKKQLTARAQQSEQQRDRAQRQDPNFDYAGALFQIAIVLTSVSIVATSRPILFAGIGLGIVATLLSLNGFLLLVNLPL